MHLHSFQYLPKISKLDDMATRGHDHRFPNGPDLNPRASTLLSESNNVVPCSDALPPQIQTENLAVEAVHQMEKLQSLSSPPNSKVLRSRRMLESLVAENSRLKAELETIRSQQAEKIERMVTDPVKTKSELRAKDDRLSRQQVDIEKQSTKVEQLLRDVNNLSAELQGTRLAQSSTQESAESKEAIDQLTTELREKDLYLRENDQVLREREFELRAMRGQLEQEQNQRIKDEAENQGLRNMINDQNHTQRTSDDSQLESERSRAESFQQEVQDLKRALASAQSQIDTGNARDQQYVNELREYQATQEAAQSAIEAEKSKSQQYLQEIDQRDAV